MVSRSKLLLALTALLIILIIVVWYFKYRYKTTVTTIPDGGTFSPSCTGDFTLISAKYTSADGSKSIRVTDTVSKKITPVPIILPISSSWLDPNSICGPKGILKLRYRCSSSTTKSKYYTPHDVPPSERSNFEPVPILKCGTKRTQVLDEQTDAPFPDQIPTLDLVVDSFQPEPQGWNSNTDWNLNAEIYNSDGPEDPDAILKKLAPDSSSDAALTLMGRLSRRSPPPLTPHPPLTMDASQFDHDYESDGLYESHVMTGGAGRPPPNNYALPKKGDDLSIKSKGLGSVYREFIFQPGSQQLSSAGYSSPADGLYAGGDTRGALITTRFMPGGTWKSKNVHAFGRGHVMYGRQYPTEAIVTNSE